MTRDLTISAGAAALALGLMWAPAGAQAPAPTLVLPIDCVVGKTCEVQNHVDHDPGPGAKDFRCSTRTYDAHGGTDIRVLDMAAQRRGVGVLAAAPGKVSRLRDGVPDVSVRADGQMAAVKGSECGNGVVIDHGGGWETQYCHLARGSVQVKVGDVVAAGQPVAKVGLSGNTEYPHLHLTVRQGARTVDPFAPSLGAGACGSGGGAALWSPAAARALAYKAGAILNAGFAAAPVEMSDVEEGRLAQVGADAPVVVAYARVISLEKGDAVEITVQAPDGSTFVIKRSEPMNSAKAQYVMFAGKRRPQQGWASGAYKARVAIIRGGRTVAERSFNTTI